MSFPDMEGPMIPDKVKQLFDFCEGLTEAEAGAVIHIGKSVWGVMKAIDEYSAAGVPAMAAIGAINLNEAVGSIAGVWIVEVRRDNE